MRIRVGGIALLTIVGFTATLTAAAWAVDVPRMEQVLQAAGADNRLP
jgi:hypothetical protein